MDTPAIIEDDTLDSASEYVLQWTQGLESGCASIAMKDDTIPVVVWSRSIGTSKNTIYFEQKGANVWPSNPESVSVSANTSKHPFCDVVGGNVHIVWEEDGKIKYRQKRGTNWNTIETVSNISLTSRSPQILPQGYVVTTGLPRMLHIVWTEGNNAPYEIRYKKISLP
ncbi:MAG: hypothetical protein B5M53_01160 [Candidatus Cloacimonas sp. 4484_209]|nr:MAG: hypothetical protein B5M53_01160 [Candidatus Cloacimonas sp. 4484_209]